MADGLSAKRFRSSSKVSSSSKLPEARAPEPEPRPKGTSFMAVTISAGLLILRVVAGLTLAIHGAQKLFGWFGGPGPTRLMQGFGKQGFKPAWLWVILVIL